MELSNPECPILFGYPVSGYGCVHVSSFVLRFVCIVWYDWANVSPSGRCTLYEALWLIFLLTSFQVKANLSQRASLIGVDIWGIRHVQSSPKDQVLGVFCLCVQF